jgi:chemotaxis protein CheX
MEQTVEAEAYKLPPAVDISSAKAIVADLSQRRGTPLAIDASDVGRIGGLGLQVLLSAKASWDQDGVALKFTKWSDAFERDIALLGAPIELSSEE